MIPCGPPRDPRRVTERAVHGICTARKCRTKLQLPSRKRTLRESGRHESAT